MQATLETKLGEDIGPYLILGTCNPQLAHQAIGIDPAIGALLPCNVVVRRHQGRTLVQALDPAIMAAVPGRERARADRHRGGQGVEAALHQLELDNS